MRRRDAPLCRKVRHNYVYVGALSPTLVNERERALINMSVIRLANHPREWQLVGIHIDVVVNAPVRDGGGAVMKHIIIGC